jgi:hypothetical protein
VPVYVSLLGLALLLGPLPIPPYPEFGLLTSSENAYPSGQFGRHPGNPG